MIGSLINEDMKVEGFLHAEDPLSTMLALNQIGSVIESVDGKFINIKKRKILFLEPEKALDLGNSGTGLRLMLGMTAGLGLKLDFIGDSSLSKRPMERVIDPLTQMGAHISSLDGMLPIGLRSSALKDNFIYELPIASAQVKSCILLAGLASRNSVTVIEPVQTRDHTERMLKNFGANIQTIKQDGKNIIHLEGQALLRARDYKVAGDISSAAFLIVGALISQSKKLEILNVGMNPTRTGILSVLEDMGAKIEILNSRIESGEPIADLVVHQSQLRGINLEGPIIANIIDELPIISIAAAFAIGNTTIRDAVELRIKESDRLKAISDGFKILGVKHDNFDDGMKIYGNSELKSNSDPIIINSQHDHRIAMSFLIAALKSSQPIQVNQCKNIFTSFPNFIELTSSLGFKIEK